LVDVSGTGGRIPNCSFSTQVGNFEELVKVRTWTHRIRKRANALKGKRFSMKSITCTLQNFVESPVDPALDFAMLGRKLLRWLGFRKY
jgi:hypothetical protein